MIGGATEDVRRQINEIRQRVSKAEDLTPYFVFALDAIQKESEATERFDGSSGSFAELCEARNVRLIRCEVLIAELLKHGPARRSR